MKYHVLELIWYIVAKTPELRAQINVVSMAASKKLSGPVIFNSYTVTTMPATGHKVPPQPAQFILHFTLSHRSEEELQVALVLVCKDSSLTFGLLHLPWFSFMVNLKGEARTEHPDA